MLRQWRLPVTEVMERMDVDMDERRLLDSA